MKGHHYVMKIRGSLLVLIVVGCSSSSAPKKSDPAPTPQPETASKPPPSPTSAEVKLCEEPEEPACPRASCGSNSPILNAFPINGLREDGECNREGVQLVPRSMNGGQDNRCKNATLSVRGNQLVGLADDGTVMQAKLPDGTVGRCDGTAVKGATFVIRGHKKAADGSMRSITVRIADIVPAYRADPAHPPRMAYRLTGDDDKSLCGSAASTAARKALGIKELKELEGVPDPSSDLAIPVQSELYDFNGHALAVSPKWKLHQPEWLQLACVNDALAERSLYNLYTDRVVSNRAALQMLMANYCGDLQATSRGTKIKWEFGTETAVNLLGSDSKLLEAQWGPDGAICMTNPRALYQQGRRPEVPAYPTGDLLTIKKRCPSCTIPAKWTEFVRSCKAFESEGPTPAPIKECKPCSGKSCDGMLYSYVVKKGNQ